MQALLILLLKGLLAGLIVGFVTASIKSWVDRFFLVILLVSMLKLPIHQAVTINLLVVGLASLMMALRQRQVLTSVKPDWAMIILPSILGGILGRMLGLQVQPKLLLLILGVYAILVGLRLVLINPMPQKEIHAHQAWQAPIAFLAGGLTGLLSAGGKPFKVPLYNWLLGHHPQKAYALAAVGVAAAAWSALASQIAVGQSCTPGEMSLAVYEFIVITLTALGIERIWTPRLGKIVAWIVAPILLLVGVRFMLQGIA